MQIYLGYFIYLPFIKESINYSTIYKNFQIKNASKTSTKTLELGDFFWTVYIKAQTDDFGKLVITVSQLKKL